MTEVFHQLGHRFRWSIDSLLEDGTGDGIIAAARYMDPSRIAQLPTDLRVRSIFDPQFFLPGSTQGSLPKYPFFPQVIADGFSTAEWREPIALDCASQCLAFQAEHRFRYLVIPTRVREGMPADFIDTQHRSFVAPFLSAFERLPEPHPLLLQLVLTDQMLRDAAYRRDLLNWITGIGQIAGVYLIPFITNRPKQITDIDLLLGLMSFIRAIKAAQMMAVLGYVNTEAALLLVADPDIVTIGSYENLRMFGTSPYEHDKDGKRRGPNARVYVSRLLQWIEHQYIGAIARVVDDPEAYFEATPYRVTMFQPQYRWHFTKPEPYKHYFLASSRQLRRLAAPALPPRADAVRHELECAAAEFQSLRDRGIVFDDQSGGGHIAPWLTALNLYLQGQE
jgi:hypothetical protein